MTKHPSPGFPVLLVLSLALILVSCEDVIKLDLKNSAARTVIEATVDAGARNCLVRVTRSLDFYQTDSFARVEGATVELVNGSGVVRVLPEVRPGVYSGTNLHIVPGEIFELNVKTSSESYTARTKVPEPVALDSLKMIRGFGDPRPTSKPVYLLDIKWKDPAKTVNYYRFKLTHNGKPQKGGFTISDDKLYNGTEVDLPLFRYRVEPGDTLRFEFQSIDSISYSYFSQVNDMERPSFVGATPYNPIGNFNNGALGYFGIFFSDIRDTIVTVRN